MSSAADGDSLGRVYTVSGEDWDEFIAAVGDREQDQPSRIVLNMGPQHPSTHGLNRFILTLEGETVTEVRVAVGYLHTGIEKSMEFRTWTQGVTFCTRMDYLSPFFTETAYCLAVERLLGIEAAVPERACVIRVMMMELNRIASHLLSVGSFGMELGASTIFLYSLRERERILDIFEMITGLRMNHAYVRPGGVACDLPPGAIATVGSLLDGVPAATAELRKLMDASPVYLGRTKNIAYLDLQGCMALGVTGPVLRSTGLPWDLRKSQPYCGYESYDFAVAVRDTGDVYGRYLVRMDEIDQSAKIVRQCVDRLSGKRSADDPVMIRDAKIGWPARLSLGPDGLGPSPEHVAHIMGGSMEALIHHFKLLTEGFRVPAGQAYVPVESPRGELGAHVISEGGTRPHRIHFRDPSFHHLQAIPVMCEGGMIADMIAAIASVDPVVGGVDR